MKNANDIFCIEFEMLKKKDKDGWRDFKQKDLQCLDVTSAKSKGPMEFLAFSVKYIQNLQGGLA